MGQDISNSADVIDSRDIIERIEELESDRDDFVIGAPDGTETPDPLGWARGNPDEAEELAALKKLADEAEGYAEDWHHGVTLVRDTYFQEYAQQFAEDTAGSKEEAELIRNGGGSHWPFTHMQINWETASDALKEDYTEVDYDGVAYWVR